MRWILDGGIAGECRVRQIIASMLPQRDHWALNAALGLALREPLLMLLIWLRPGVRIACTLREVQ